MTARYVVQWFGPFPWGPALDPNDDHHLILRVEPPLGELCLGCQEPIREDDYGQMVPYSQGPPEAPTARLVPVHKECLTLGTSGHLVGVCGCTDYLGLTLRQAALEVDRRLRRLAMGLPYLGNPSPN